MEFSEISRRTNHSIEAIANYVDKFKRVIALAKDNYEIHTIAFFVKISKSLAQQYYDLYRASEIVEQRKEELDELLKKTNVQP
jgi:arginyl-tRNA synthetase